MFLIPATYKKLHSPIFISGPLLGQFMSDWSIKKCIEPFASEIEKFSKIFEAFFFKLVFRKICCHSKKTPMPTNGTLKP